MELLFQELAKQKFKKEMEKSEIRALEMVRTLWGLDEVGFTLCYNDIPS